MHYNYCKKYWWINKLNLLNVHCKVIDRMSMLKSVFEIYFIKHENIYKTCESVKINWFNNKKYVFTDESVKRQLNDPIRENLTDSSN